MNHLLIEIWQHNIFDFLDGDTQIKCVKLYNTYQPIHSGFKSISELYVTNLFDISDILHKSLTDTYLKKFHKLKKLKVNCVITNNGIKHLNLPNSSPLHVLDLCYNKNITSDGINHMHNLHTFYTTNTKIKYDDIKHLKNINFSEESFNNYVIGKLMQIASSLFMLDMFKSGIRYSD